MSRGGWCTVYPLGREGSSEIAGQLRQHRDVFFHAWVAAVHPTESRAVFVLVGHPYVLQYLADRIAADGLAWTRTWASLPDLRSDNTAVAVALKEAWRDGVVSLPGRIAGFEDDDGEA